MAFLTSRDGSLISYNGGITLIGHRKFRTSQFLIKKVVPIKFQDVRQIVWKLLAFWIPNPSEILFLFS